MTVSTEDVRALLSSKQSDAVLVLIEGRIEVVTPAELDSAEYRGALQIATREQLIAQTGGSELSNHELAEQAEELDSALRNLGG
jgi:hypothetical protein